MRLPKKGDIDYVGDVFLGAHRPDSHGVRVRVAGDMNMLAEVVLLVRTTGDDGTDLHNQDLSSVRKLALSYFVECSHRYLDVQLEETMH